MATATPMLPLTTPVAVTALAPGERWNLPVPESDGRPGTSAGSNTDSGSAVAPAPHDSTVVPATASAAPDATPGGGERQAARDAAGEGEVSEEEADDLQELDEEDRQLLQAARRRDEEDAGMRERVAEDVEGLMDNGVRMNPWLGAYCRTGGGSGGGSQAAVQQQQPPLAQRGAAVGAAGRGRPLELSGLHLAAAAHRSWIDDELWEGAAEEGWTVDDDGSGGHHRYVSPTGHPFTSKRAALAVGGVGPDGRRQRRRRVTGGRAAAAAARAAQGGGGRPTGAEWPAARRASGRGGVMAAARTARRHQRRETSKALAARCRCFGPCSRHPVGLPQLVPWAPPHGVLPPCVLALHTQQVGSEEGAHELWVHQRGAG